MDRYLKNKIMFFASPAILAVITMIWLFYKDGRWYYYKQEWPYVPLLALHLLFPVFYFGVFIVRIIWHIDKYKRSSADVFYIVSSMIMTALCIGGLFTFLLFTSGA